MAGEIRGVAAGDHPFWKVILIAFGIAIQKCFFDFIFPRDERFGLARKIRIAKPTCPFSRRAVGE